MEALTLTREVYKEGLSKIETAVADNTTYLDKFTITFPEGLNTASSLEICRAMQDPSLETKIHLMKLCISGKNVQVKCPNGDVETFKIADQMASLDGLPLFQKEPLALVAISDCVYGYLLKKSLRLSNAPTAAAMPEKK